MTDTHPSQPKVHVVIPCFNHGKYVGEAVRSCLRQVGADLRVTIVNDGSTDAETAAACEDCCKDPSGGRVSVIHQSNLGLPAARNVGAAVASGDGWSDYLVFLDADDWIEPTFVERLHQALLASEDDRVSHAYCQEQLVEMGTGIWRVPDWDLQLLLVTNLHPVTALIRRSCFQAVGGFDVTMNLGYEDWELWLRLAEAGYRGLRVREPLFNWRRHSASTMVTGAVKRHDTLFAMLMQRHPRLYAAHASEVIRRSNSLLRRADANWLDESGDAIVIRDLRAWTDDLVRERTALREELALAQEQAAIERQTLETVTRMYEAKPVIRLSRSLFRTIDRLPSWIGSPIRAMAHFARSASTPRLSQSPPTQSQGSLLRPPSSAPRQ